jgi:carboxylesterase type B
MGTVKDQHIHLSHPQLGPIKGLIPLTGVHQFRSLPYATIPHRFADPILAKSLSATEVTFDATEFGPVAPQPDDAEYQEFVTEKEHIPHKPLVRDELKCCNLNVSVPTGQRKDGGKGIPVMVWFHGGSFMLGAASWPQYGIWISMTKLTFRFCKVCQIVC